MIFVVRPDGMRDEESLKKLQERLAAEINSEEYGMELVLPSFCLYVVVT